MDKDVGRIFRAIAILSLSACVLFAHPAYADTRNLALVRCNADAGELIVQEDSTEDDPGEYKTPDGYQMKWLDDLVEYITPPNANDDATSGTYRHKVADWKLTCKLKGVTYNIVISPWSENDKVMGECGGGDPDLELTVRRDNHLLVKDLEFGGVCSMGPSTPPVIGMLKLSEPQQTATVNGTTIPYSQMPALDREKLKQYTTTEPVALTPPPRTNGACSLDSAAQVAIRMKYTLDKTPSADGALFECKDAPGESGIVLVAFVTKSTAADASTDGTPYDLQLLNVKAADQSMLSRIVQHRAFWADETDIHGFRIDTAPYQLAPNVRAFGIRWNTGNPSKEMETLTLFVADGNTFRDVLALDTRSGEHVACQGDLTESTLSIAPSTHHGYADLNVRAVRTEGSTDTGDCNGKSQQVRTVQKYSLRYDGTQYR